MVKHHTDYIKKFLAKKNIKLRHIVYGLVIIAVLLTSTLQILDISPYRKTTSGIEYVRAKVLKVENTQADTASDQNVQVKIMEGEDKGHAYVVTRSLNFGDDSYKRLPIGSEVLLTKNVGNGNQYSYGERWHMPGVATLFFILLVLVVLVGWWRGITSIFGLVISIGVLSAYVLPRILAGQSPYATCIIGAFIITGISVYVAHGFSRRTSIAFISSITTLVAIIGLVAMATYLVGTSEVISEETSAALYGPHAISLAGLLTGGIIIASLGVLYDITTGQAAAVDEIYKANKKLSTIDLYRKGLSVGREHIAALINTLALVYVGIALPSIVVTALLNNHAPLVVSLNSEAVVEEIVRTGVASIGTLLAVPITTGLAAYLLPRW